MESIINLSEEITPLWDFMPLNGGNTEYAIRLLSNNFVSKDDDFYNNPTLNICHFYIFVLHNMLHRLYICKDQHIELLKYIQITSEVFKDIDSDKDTTLRAICSKEFSITLFNKLEREAIKFFFYLFNIDKTNDICQKNTSIFDLRNRIAHLNYVPVRYESFLDTINKICMNLQNLSQMLYEKITQYIFLNEITPLIDQNLIDDTNYIEYFNDINIKYGLCEYDYKLCIENKLIETLDVSYKAYLKLYIDNKAFED
ncbi:MAG: hypothetical protein FWH43_00900 [Endomicrobia bacterium]|nr:hypothetical protein [Endomicrobiia bacterium]